MDIRRRLSRLYRLAQDIHFALTLLGALGAAAVVAGVLGGVAELPTASLVLIGVGAGLLSLPVVFVLVSLTLSVLPRYRPQATEEEQRVEWLRKWDQNQRQNWRQYISLELLDVDCSHVNEASSFVRLKMVIRNFLLVPLKLVRVMDSSGTVAVHTLPSLPENYDVTVPPCSEREFYPKLPIHGTDVPNHLRFEASVEHPRALEWVVRGTWQVEVYGSLQDGWDPSHKLTYQAVPNVPS